jgi:hypothetical protein
MRTLGTPWANTLRIAGSIFIHDAADIKLSQVAGYVVGVADLASRAAPIVLPSESLFGARPGSGRRTGC